MLVRTVRELLSDRPMPRDPFWVAVDRVRARWDAQATPPPDWEQVALDDRRRRRTASPSSGDPVEKGGAGS
jgi:hypothetical protein